MIVSKRLGEKALSKNLYLLLDFFLLRVWELKLFAEVRFTLT
jgi:hypothetical protein